MHVSPSALSHFFIFYCPIYDVRCAYCDEKINDYDDSKPIVFCDFYCIGNYMKDCLLAKEQDAKLCKE